MLKRRDLTDPSARPIAAAAASAVSISANTPRLKKTSWVSETKLNNNRGIKIPQPSTANIQFENEIQTAIFLGNFTHFPVCMYICI